MTSNNNFIENNASAPIWQSQDLSVNKYDWGGAINIAKEHIKTNEGWRAKTYQDTGGTPTIGYGFTNSGFREKYAEGITNHYSRGMTPKQAQEELGWALNKASKVLDKIYGNYNLTDAQKAAILDTYYQRPASVSTNSRFYKALKAGDRAAVNYLGVAGYDARNKKRQLLYMGDSHTKGENIIAPADNTRVARPDIDFTIKRSNPFQNVKVETQALPEVGNMLQNNTSVADFLKSVTPQTPNALQPVSQYQTTGQLMQNYDNLFNSLDRGNTFDLGGILETATTGMGILGDAAQQAKIADTSEIEQNISNLKKSTDSSAALANNNDDILNMFANRQTISGVNAGDLRNNSLLGDALSAGKSGLQGTMAGVKFGPAGAIIGGIAGGLSSVVGSIFGRNKAAKKAAELTNKINQANQRIDANLDYASDRVDEQNDLRALQNYNALGGFLNNKFQSVDAYGLSSPGFEVGYYADGGGLSTHGSDFSNGLTSVDEGGKHGENPNGGVPMGTDNQGIPNLVEEGETIWKGDYVFSDRMKVPKELRDKYHLPDDITYAEASKILSKESKDRPNDPISKRTLNVALGELSDMQEQKRGEKQERQAANQPQPQQNPQDMQEQQAQQIQQQQMQQQGGQPQMSDTQQMIDSLGGEQEYALGGFLGHIFANGGTPYDYYDPSNPDYPVVGYSKAYKDSVAGLTADDVRNWAKTHADNPSLQSYLKGNNLNNLTTEQFRAGATDGKYGFMHQAAKDLMNSKKNGELPFTVNNLAVKANNTIPAFLNTKYNGMTVPQNISATTTPKKSNFLNTYMRYAPIAGNIAMGIGNLLNKPDYTNANAIINAANTAGAPISLPSQNLGDYRTKQPFDERYLTNLLNQNNAAAIRSSLNVAGGNRAMGLAAIMANNAAYEDKLSDAARQAYAANRAEDAQVADFNRGTNMFNAQSNSQRNQAEAQINAQRQANMLNGISRGYTMKQALDDQRGLAFSQNMSNAMQGLGDIGWENSQRNWLQGLSDSDVLKGMFDSNSIKDFAGITHTAKKAYGGKLKTKKRRF